MGFSPQVSGPGARGQKAIGQRGTETLGAMGRSGRYGGGVGGGTGGMADLVMEATGGQTGAFTTPEDWVDFYSRFTTPSWEGAYGAGPTALQRLAVGASMAPIQGMQGLFQNPLMSVGPLASASMNRPYAPGDVYASLMGAGSPYGEAALANIAGGGYRPDIMGLLTAGEDVERRRIGEEAAALRAGFGAAGTRRSVGAGRAEADLRARMAEGGLAERQRLATTTLAGLMPVEAGAAQALMSGGIERGLGAANVLGGMYGQEGMRQLQAALGLPGATATAAGTPYDILTQAFGLGEQQRQISDQELLRRMTEFQRTQGAMFGPYLGAMMGLPVAAGPGVGTQLLSGATTLGGSYLGGK